MQGCTLEDYYILLDLLIKNRCMSEAEKAFDHVRTLDYQDSKFAPRVNAAFAKFFPLQNDIDNALKYFHKALKKIVLLLQLTGVCGDRVT